MLRVSKHIESCTAVQNTLLYETENAVKYTLTSQNGDEKQHRKNRSHCSLQSKFSHHTAKSKASRFGSEQTMSYNIAQC